MERGAGEAAVARRGLMLVLSSPSGAGKTTLTRSLVEKDRNLKLSISVTTRPKRPSEVDGVHYHFISRSRFEAMRRSGELLEFAKVHGNLYGTPRKPAELRTHNCLNMANAPALRRWPFEGKNGVEHVEVQGNLTATSADALFALALRGLGVIRLTDVIVGEAIREGRLVPLLADVHHREAVPLHAVYPQGRHRSPRLAAVIDFLVERLRPSLSWEVEASEAAMPRLRPIR